MPTLNTAAPKLKSSNDNGPTQVAYTQVWNGMDFPCGTIPFTVVKENEQTYESIHNDKFTKGFKKNMENTAGMPIGLQVIGPSNSDELVLNFMKRLESKFKQIDLPEIAGLNVNNK